MTPPPSLPVRESLRFLQFALPRAATVLDVGSGAGALAAALLHRGHRVTAIDPLEDAVAAARALGIEAHVSTVEAWQPGPDTRFDVVLFSQSLHHVQVLDEAIAAAHRLLRPGGLVVLEEIAIDAMDATTALWHYDTLDLARDGGGQRDDDGHGHGHGHGHGAGAGVEAGLAERRELSPLLRWKQDHVHDVPLHGSRAMHEAVARRFEVRSVTRGAYLYRSLTGLPEARMEAYLARENLRIEQNVIVPIGFRLVAERTD